MRRMIAAVLLSVGLLAGCHSRSTPAPQQADSNSHYKTYSLRGKVVSTNPATGEVVLDHEAIPGFMEAMTMPYKLKDPSILSELHPGDVITAKLYVSQDADADVFIDQIVVVGQGRPDYKPMAQYHVPTQGDVVPDFHLRDQDGKSIHLAQFRGKTLLITFIYTRCPLPNFCPLVTHNFASIEKQLSEDPGILQKSQLLCVSFDPDHDTPERLRAYGAQYIGSDSESAFAHWSFAVPDKKILSDMAHFFDVGITVGANEQITHTLSTTLIDPNGKVVQFYPGNDWTAAQLLADMRNVIRGV